MQVVDNITGREIVFSSVFSLQGIQVMNYSFKICPNHIEAIRKAYGILDDVMIRAPEVNERVDWVVDG